MIDKDGLRKQAEKIARQNAARSSEDARALSPEESRRTLHELRVHQIELEMQNEELRRAQAELDISRARYFDLYDMAPVGYVTVNEKGLILEANLTAATLLGVARGALVRQLFSRFILKEDMDIYYLHRKQVFETAEPRASELRMVKKDGTAFWTHLEATAAKDEGGNPLFRVTVSDITERKRKEAALRESEEKYRVIFNNEIFAICIFDRETLKMLDINDAFVKLYGYSREELVSGMTIHDITAEHQASDAASTQAKREGTIYIPLRYHRKKDGTVFPLEIIGGPYEWKGHRVMFGMMHDITERKLAEDTISSLLAEKELILREVHHRIKNYMSTIHSLLALQAGFLKDPLAIAALEDAQNRVESMRLLYDRLYQPVDYKEISVLMLLPSLVDEIIANFPNSTSVRIEKKIDDFILDAKKLQPLGIIINELLTNIMKYAFTGRSDGLITVSASLKGNTASIAIEDNGNGMPEAVDFEHSTGFGLMLVGMLTKQLEGAIRIEREHGTRIVLEFEK